MNVIRAVIRRLVEWNNSPQERTPEEVAGVLLRALDGTATHSEMDYFISVDIADPTLNAIKDEVGALYGPGWDSRETRDALHALLRRVQSMTPEARN